MYFLIYFLSLLTLYLSGLVLCFTNNSNIGSIIIGSIILLIALSLTIIMISEYIKEKSNPEINIKKINLERKLYKELGNLDIDSAKKIIDTKENSLKDKSKMSEIREFYFKYIKKEINEKEIAEKVLSSIIRDKEIKEKKLAKKENKKMKELADKKEIKIISI